MAITIIATANMMAFADILFDIRAATGDANALPITKPATASQWALLSIKMNVSEPIKAIKKRDNLTVPKEKRG